MTTKKGKSYAALDRQARHFERAAKEAPTKAAREKAGRLLGKALAEKRALKK